MVVNRNIMLFALIALTSATSCFAADTTWDFTTSSSSSSYGSGNVDGNVLTFNEGGEDLTVTAWADTDGSDVETATAAHNAWGLLNYNQYSGDGHYVDNGRDTDMLLLSFDSSVSLSSIQLGYFRNDSDISIAAFSSAPVLAGNTWSEVASNAFFSTSYANIGTSVFAMNNLIGGAVVEAQYWLIGAYNSVFGGLSDSNMDKLKIAALTTSPKTPSPKPPIDVAEPSTFAMFASFGLFVLWRRKNRI